MDTNLSIQQKSIASLFKNYNDMHIPLYQRGYAWEKEQVEELWEDLLEVIADNQSSHFFGQVVMNQNSEEQRHYIIDGQQRVTTTVILMAVIRNKLSSIAKNLDDDLAKMRAKDAHKNFFESNGLSDFIFTQSEELSEYFNRNIQAKNSFNKDKKSLKGSEKNVFDAYNLLDRNISMKLKEISKDKHRDYLYQLLETFTEKFSVIVLVTPDEAAAFVIFETLNARGRDLDAGDLLKNHILRTSKSDKYEVKNSWNRMVKTINAGSGKSLTTKYIRAYWNSKWGFVTEKKLYKKIYSEIKTTVQVNSLVKDLVELSEPFEAIINPKKTEFFESDVLRETLIALDDLNSKTYYPVILAMYKQQFSENDILKVAHKIYSFVVRNFTIGNIVANKYEKLFSKIAMEINTSDLSNVDAINREIIKETRDDRLFKNDFYNAEIKTDKASKHILAETFYNEDRDKIVINTVKVFKLNKNIKNADLLGNKVLLSKSEADLLKKSSDIKSILKNSKFEHTRKMADRIPKSNTDALKIQKQAFEYAVDFWK
ncbi:DUF262 domain-containing protein [Companilactobacillus mishanensis]|uniref:DUF262 domain-containing protein n=1 Tax=Companilactobacillus mishanensis TaxID=2486008 RepID=UPI0012960C2C|nr:DUF262 domain-containing protein [Companilactobacillus mishanensis]MQS90302.1 DUF262 domain-containing protein [Companilactobacillus mishanensis]